MQPQALALGWVFPPFFSFWALGDDICLSFGLKLLSGLGGGSECGLWRRIYTKAPNVCVGMSLGEAGGDAPARGSCCGDKARGAQEHLSPAQAVINGTERQNDGFWHVYWQRNLRRGRIYVSYSDGEKIFIPMHYVNQCGINTCENHRHRSRVIKPVG